ncbi:MAG TPA: hypothetical protein VLD18_10045, partial [Verrucomicrobiae bacterium]|nr:hypothetical protein [Verrucomicrobiae bacterium]
MFLLSGPGPVLAGTHVWTGAVNGYWSTPGNWEGNAAPTNAAESGIVLRFPAGAIRVISTNNIDHLSLLSVQLQGTGHVLRSVGNYSLSFAPGGFAINIVASGNGNTIGCPMQFSGGCSLSVSSNQLLTVSGTLTGPGSLVKFGEGTLVLAGNGPNTLLGGFTVNSGIVRLRQSNGVALPGPTRLGYGATNPTAPATLQFQAHNQLPPHSTLSLLRDGVVALNGFSNAVGYLSMVGGTVTTASNTSPGLLTVNNDILADGRGAVPT